MAAFFLAVIDKITDDKMYKEYVDKAAPVVRKYGGEYIFRSEQLTPVSGDWGVKRMILIRFENKEKIQRCFQSVEYTEIMHLRENSTLSKAIIIEK